MPHVRIVTRSSNHQSRKRGSDLDKPCSFRLTLQERFMGMNKLWLAAGAAALVLGGGLLVAVKIGAADENDKKAKAAVEKIMKSLEDDKKDDAAKDAKALAGAIQ